MGFFNFLRSAKGARASRAAAVRTQLSVEGLESRVVPYSVSGNAWPNPQLVTISFVPDGTVLGANGNGYITSNLFTSFNAKFGSTSAWQNQILKAAQAWAQQTNINFAVVADSGADIGSGNYQQGDPNMGDIRIGGYSFGTSTLAQTYMPPPINNYSLAGDMQFNTGKTWNIGSTYDLATVAEHELGHALGLYHSGVMTAAMYSNYHGLNAAPTTDDINGIRSIYSGGNPRSPDSFNSGSVTNGLVGSVLKDVGSILNPVTNALGLGTTSNSTFATATSLAALIDPQTLAGELTSLNLNTTANAEYFTVTAPQQTSSTVTVTAQSSGLSLLAPTLTVYAGDQTTVLGTASGAGQYGTTLQVSLNNVSAGQQFYIKVAGADTSAFGTGAYALTFNFGTGATPTVTPPNTQLVNGNPLSAGGGQAMLMSTETQVNSWSLFDQKADGARAVGMDAAGNYVVVWSSQWEDWSGWGVFAQRFNAAGVALGSEFRVNSNIWGDQNAPAVAVNPDGSFVVAWQSKGQDGSGWGVYAQRYDAAGVAQGGEFRVNTTAAGDQKTPAVAADAHGNFIVTWSSQNQDGSGWGIYGQRYDSSGGAQDGEFRVNTTTAGDQQNARVAVDATGNFVVVWTSSGQDGSGLGVYGQRYNADGRALGREFQVNNYTSGDQTAPAVAMDAAGDFVVAWQSQGQDGSGWGVYARRFDTNGVGGKEFVVPNTTAGDQQFATVAMDSKGNFVIGWSSQGQDGSGWGSYGRQFSAAGVALGNEFMINTTTAGDQVSPSWALTDSGNAVAVWSGNGTLADNSGVFMQRFLITQSSGMNDLEDDYYEVTNADGSGSTTGSASSQAPAPAPAAVRVAAPAAAQAVFAGPATSTPHTAVASPALLATAAQTPRPEGERRAEPAAASAPVSAFPVGLLPGSAPVSAPVLVAAAAPASGPVAAIDALSAPVTLSFAHAAPRPAADAFLRDVLGQQPAARQDSATPAARVVLVTPGWPPSVAVQTPATLWPRVCADCFADLSWLEGAASSMDTVDVLVEGTDAGLSPALLAGLAAALAILPSVEGLRPDARNRRPVLRPRGV